MEAAKIYINADFEIELYQDGAIYYSQGDECVIMSTDQAIAAARAILKHFQVGVE